MRQTSIELAGLGSHHPESLVFTSEIEEELLPHPGADGAVERSLIVDPCSSVSSQFNQIFNYLTHQSNCILPDGFAGEFEHRLQTPGGS